MMEVLDTGIGTAEQNMLLDAKLLSELDPGGCPILHLYKWAKKSATYGYLVDPKKHLDLDQVARWDIDLARRPTGGGIVFHIWDLAFSFLMPSGHKAFSVNTLDNYRFVNQAVLETVQSYFSLPAVELIAQNGVERGPECQNFCMAKPTQCDVVYQGMKIAGAAQRRRKQGYLHQGTISLARPQIELLKDVLLSKEEVLLAMQDFTFAPLSEVDATTGSGLQNLLAEKLQLALAY